MLENRGTLNYTGDGVLFGRNTGNLSARIENAAGGVFLVDGEGDFSPNFSSANYRIENAGTFIKRGAGTTTIVNNPVSFNSTGIVQIESGKLDLLNNYTQSGSGRLELTLGAPDASAGYRSFRVTGNATLDGTLSVILVSPFAENVNSVFEIANFTSRSGDFSSVEGLTNNFGYTFSRAYAGNSLNLTVQTAGSVPPPAGAIAFGSFLKTAFGPESGRAALAPDADPDRDGVCNLLEYAFATDPNDSQSCATPELGRVSIDGREYVTIAYTRRKNTTGVQIVAETSRDLVTWHANNSSETVTRVLSIRPSPGHQDSEIVTEAAVAPIRNSPPTFLRVHVFLQQP